MKLSPRRCCCALAPAADTDRKAAAIDGIDKRTDGRTPDRYETLHPVASFRGPVGSADPPRIVKCESFALPASTKGSLYISHNGR